MDENKSKCWKAGETGCMERDTRKKSVLHKLSNSVFHDNNTPIHYPFFAFLPSISLEQNQLWLFMYFVQVMLLKKQKQDIHNNIYFVCSYYMALGTNAVAAMFREFPAQYPERELNSKTQTRLHCIPF